MDFFLEGTASYLRGVGPLAVMFITVDQTFGFVPKVPVKKLLGHANASCAGKLHCKECDVMRQSGIRGAALFTLLLIIGVVFSSPRDVLAYNFNGHTIAQDVWYQTSVSFTQTTRDAIRDDMRAWNAYLPQYRRLCYDTQTHPLGNYPLQDGFNRIYKVPMASSSTLAENTYYYLYIGGKRYLQESDINVNANKTWTNGYSPTAFDVKSVMLHELGHSTGLSHSSYRSAVMYFEFDKGEIRDRLTNDDINGVKALY